MKYGIGIRQMVCVAACAAVLLGAPASWAEEPGSRTDLLQKIRERRGLPARRMVPGDQVRRTPQTPSPEQAVTEPPQPAPDPAAPEVKTPRVTSRAAVEPTPPVAGQVEGNLVSLDFNDVDLTVFIKFISEITGKNFIIDQNVRTKVTVICPAKIPVDEAYRVFESVLEVYGFATVEAGDIIKVVKAGDARSKSIQTGMVQESRSPEDRLVTQIIPLKYADANEIKGLFTPLVSKDSVLLAYPSTNMLILTDTHSNIQRLLKILEAIDVTGIGRQISVIPLEYADASKMVSILEVMFRESVDKGGPPQRGGAGTEPADKIRLVADDRANVVILLGSEVETTKVKKLIALLDKKVQQGKERIHVYYLKNADAEELAKVLQMLPDKQGGEGADGGKKPAPVLSKAINVTADVSTNSLIIMADRDDFVVLKEIIEKLDIPRSMVYIECLIAEVNIDKNFELGVEWIVGGKASYEDKEGAYAFGFGGASDTGFPNVARMALGAGLPSGFSVGAVAKPIVVGGKEYPNLGAVVRAFKKDKDVQILSTPQLMTTDNQEATITVGKNIPYLTKIGTTSSEETYSNYEYKDVGISLKIKPQINENRLIRLDITQELTKLDQLTTVSMDRPATLKRTIATNVIVHDEHTIVIGGLIDDSMSRVEYKVPCLGDIPFLGWLFKGMSKSSEKTNLLVFLTPHVVKTAQEASDIYKQKQSDMDALRGGSFSLYSGESKADAHNGSPSEALAEPSPEEASHGIPDKAETAAGEDTGEGSVVVIEAGDEKGPEAEAGKPEDSGQTVTPADAPQGAADREAPTGEDVIVIEGPIVIDQGAEGTPEAASPAPGQTEAGDVQAGPSGGTPAPEVPETSVGETPGGDASQGTTVDQIFPDNQAPASQPEPAQAGEEGLSTP